VLIIYFKAFFRCEEQNVINTFCQTWRWTPNGLWLYGALYSAHV